MMRDFIHGFIHGARTTPTAFFAPAVAVWRLLLNTTESVITRGKDPEAESKHE